MGAKAPEVSIVLPFYNAPHLSNAIESILNQTFPDFELILIDNGSTDESCKVASEYASTDDRIVLIQEPKRGVVYAANTGIRASKGDYIARMDADDYSFPDRIGGQVEALKHDTTIDVVSGNIEYEGDEKNKGFVAYVNWLNSIITNEEIRMNQFVEFPLANPSLMFRRIVFEKFGVFMDGDFPEDYEFFLRLQSHRVKMTKINSNVLRWRDSNQRLTRTDEKYSHSAFFRIKAKYLALWLANNNPFHPNVLIWGAGRVSRRRSDYLIDHGINISGYVDVKQANNVIHYENVQGPEKCFIVSYVANRGARDEIRSFLSSRGFTEGVNYIIAS